MSSVGRRTWLKGLAGAGGAGVLAGCFGEEDDIDDVADVDEPVAPDAEIDEKFVLPAVGDLDLAHFNTWSQDHNLFYEIRLLWDGLTYFKPVTDAFEPELATDWDFDMDEGLLTIDIREGIEWHNGNALTADDVANHFKLAEVWGDPLWDHATAVHTPDEHVLALEFEPVAQSLIKHLFLGDTFAHFISTHPDLHREFIERYEDGDDHATIQEDLANFSIDGNEAMEAGIGHGPVELVNVTESRLDFERYDDYPTGWKGDNDMNWSGFVSIDFGDTEAAFHEATALETIHGFTGDTSAELRATMADHWNVIMHPQVSFQAIQFSPDSLWGENTEKGRALRQAIAYMFDPEEYVHALGEEIADLPDPNNVTGLNRDMDEQWLSDVLGSFTSYGSTADGWVMEEEAEQKMNEAGFEREGEEWVETDAGNRLEVDILFPINWDGLVRSNENVLEQFNRFGIAAEGNGQDSTTMASELMPAHDFDVAVFSTGPATWNPASSYRETIGSVSAADTARYNNELSEVDVPWPPGDSTNDIQTVDVDAKIRGMMRSKDDTDMKEYVEELAWVYNQWVHGIQCLHAYRINYVATDKWEWEYSPEDSIMKSEQPWAHHTRAGTLHGR